MKLQYLNYTALRKFARKNDRRLSTSFLQKLDEHCGAVLENSVDAAKEDVTLTDEHITTAIEQTN